MPLPDPEFYSDWKAYARDLSSALNLEGLEALGGLLSSAQAEGTVGSSTPPAGYKFILRDEDGFDKSLWIWNGGSLPTAPELFQVDTTDIADAAIVTSKMANSAVTSTILADLAVEAAKLADQAVTEAKLGNSAVTATKIANLAVGAAAIADLAVGTAKIGDGAIVTAKIGELSVTTGKIADLAVNNAKIANLAVNSAKIDDLAVTNAKIDNLAVSRAKIELLAIDTARIDDLAVTNAKIGNLAVDNAKIADLAVTNAKISGILQSDNYVAGVSGWKIDKAGAVIAEFNGVILSRDQVLDTDSINYGLIDTVETSGFQALVDTVNFVPFEFFYDTGVAVNSWVNNTGPVAVTAVVSGGSVVSSSNPTDAKWAVTAEIVPVIRFFGAATIHLRFRLFGEYIADFNPLIITYTLYKVT